MSEKGTSPLVLALLILVIFLVLGRSYSGLAALVLALIYQWPSSQKRGSVQTKSQQQSKVSVHPPRYEDPLRWSFIPSNGVLRANTLEPTKHENDFCELKGLAMHRPTHEPWREASRDYPYAWHLHGRKRLWEIRVQMRLKQVPSSKLYFGVELQDCEAGGGGARHMKQLLRKAVKGAIGEFYYSDGDDPSKVGPGEEVEPCTFVMPLWAFDQFVVSEVGQEPDITGDLTNVGMRRSDGLKAYVKELQKCINEFSTEKVYTFCIWGVSQFLDCIRWEAGGIFPGMTMSFARLGVQSPLNIAVYDMPGEHSDERHLRSRKRYYLNVAMWSMLNPPEREKLSELIGPEEEDVVEEGKPQHSLRRAMDVFACCSGFTRAYL